MFIAKNFVTKNFAILYIVGVMVKKNPFKFGSVVEGAFFTNRTREIAQVTSILNSENHLILIGPRRFGKTSLVFKVTKSIGRPVIHLNAQMLTSSSDFARQLINGIFKNYTYQKIKHWFKDFRIIPTVLINPKNGETEISFSTGKKEEESMATVEDALNLLERVSTSSKKIIVVIDEFQDMLRLDDGLDKVMRSVMQHHTLVNYVFFGSQESMMKEIFENKKSTFYHFGQMMYLDKIPEREFRTFLEKRFREITPSSKEYASLILRFTDSHPYYTQQLSWMVWDTIQNETDQSPQEVMDSTIKQIVRMHDMDYDRLWYAYNLTDRKVLTGISLNVGSPLSLNFIVRYDLTATSTVNSSLSRLSESGIVIKTRLGWQIDDPFFKEWILWKREGSVLGR